MPISSRQSRATSPNGNSFNHRRSLLNPPLMRSRDRTEAPTPELSSTIPSAPTSQMPTALMTPTEIVAVVPRIQETDNQNSPHITAIENPLPPEPTELIIPPRNGDISEELTTRLIVLAGRQGTLPSTPATGNAHERHNEEGVATVLTHINLLLPTREE